MPLINKESEDGFQDDFQADWTPQVRLLKILKLSTHTGRLPRNDFTGRIFTPAKKLPRRA